MKNNSEANSIMRQLLCLLSIATIVILVGCRKDIPVINESDEFSICNDQLVACSGSPVGGYCLFGYKWGEDQNFDDDGVNAIGPRTPGGTLTFSFQERNGTVNTSRQAGVPSESWDEILDCARGKIRIALRDWEQVADISFEELPENSEADIKFYTAALFQSAVGYPNYPESPCNMLSGDVIFDANSRERSCDGFYINALHEVGHVLGLGHVSSANVMATGTDKFSLPGLQEGDIEGVQQIYGEKP